jgi:hypothetical protein
MYPKRPAVAVILVLSLVLIASGALNAPIGYAQARPNAIRASQVQEQAHSDQSHLKPSPDKLHLASLSNGGFEAGRDGTWTEYSAVGRPLITNLANLPLGTTPHTGNWLAWLGGTNNEMDYITQTVDIPANHPILSFWMLIDSQEYGCRYDYDFGTVSINNTWVTSIPLCIPENTGGWVKRTLNLSAYAGQTVELQFRAQNDGSLPSSLYIDDVAIEEPSFGHSVYLPIVSGNGCSGYNYFDDFGAPSGAWYPGIFFNGEYGVTAHQYTFDGEYQLRFEGPDMWWYAHDLSQAIPSSSYRVEADMRSAADYTAGTYGLRFGVHWYEASPGDWEMDQTYQIVIDPYYQDYFVEKLVGGNWTTLRNWTYSGAIRKNSATNHLRVDRIGTSIRVYINGTAMPALTDASITASGRDAGVVAFAYDDYPVDMRFDNFHVTTCVQ